MSSAKSERADLRPVDRCEDCGRFVGRYPVGFYDDRFCRRCFDLREDARKLLSRPVRWIYP